MTPESQAFDPSNPGFDPQTVPDAVDSVRDALTEILADPVVQRTRPTGEPHTWQASFERDIKTLSERGASLADDLAKIVGEAENKHFWLQTNASGALTDVRCRPAARGANAEQLTAAFAEVYAAARGQAEQAMTELLQASGLQSQSGVFDAAAEPQ